MVGAHETVKLVFQQIRIINVVVWFQSFDSKDVSRDPGDTPAQGGGMMPTPCLNECFETLTGACVTSLRQKMPRLALAFLGVNPPRWVDSTCEHIIRRHNQEG